MSNVLTQPDSSSFSERDKINYCFKVIDDILEGVFKPRFKLLCKLVDYKESRFLQDNSSIDFGNLINKFLESEKETARLFLKDPIFFISTNLNLITTPNSTLPKATRDLFLTHNSGDSNFRGIK